MLIDPFVGQELVMLMAQQSAEDLEALAALADSGQLKAKIDRRYALEEIADAIRYSETGRARGKIIIEVDG
jgi:NADPH:quinone reductase-like Zn-dependent oxidoreductase